MSLLSTARRMIGTAVWPIARFYIRYSPIPFLKKSLWDRFRWREGDYCARTRLGIQMQGHSLDLVQGYIYYFGIWEPSVTAFIDDRLKNQRGRVFVDVGANVGYFSLLAARRLPEGKAVAIEAFPSTFDKLVDNVRLNRLTNVRTVHCAATDGRRSIPMFYAGPNNVGGTSSIQCESSPAPTLVPGLPFSEILSDEELGKVRLIKIDVEGAEYEVVQGMKSVMPRFQRDVEIIVEIGPKALGQKKLGELWNIFEEAGYYAYAVDNTYKPDYYLFSCQVFRPIRIRTAPGTQTDVVFSRIDAEHL